MLVSEVHVIRSDDFKSNVSSVPRYLCSVNEKYAFAACHLSTQCD